MRGCAVYLNLGVERVVDAFLAVGAGHDQDPVSGAEPEGRVGPRR